MTLLDRVQDNAGSRRGAAVDGWVDVCDLDDLLADVGACALIDGAPVAIFRTGPDDELFALGNIDPFTSASVMSRGIVGSVGELAVVASPMLKNRFALRTGESLDNPAVALPTYAIQVVDGRVLVSATSTSR